MKLLQRLDIKNNKVLMGLLSLLFIGSAVQTSAILNIQGKVSDNQNAQVLNPISRTCLTVSHKYNEDSIDYFTNENSEINRFSNFISYFSVRNRCTYDVRILKLYKEFTNFGGFDLFNAEYRNSLGEFVTRPDDTTIFGGAVSSENVNCIDCVNSVIYNYFAEPFNTGTYLIPAGQTRDFSFVANFTSSQFTELQNLRMVLSHIDYVRSSDVDDGNITESEVRKHRFSASEKKLHAHDLVNVVPHPVVGSDGLIMKPTTKPTETKVEVKTKTN